MTQCNIKKNLPEHHFLNDPLTYILYVEEQIRYIFHKYLRFHLKIYFDKLPKSIPIKLIQYHYFQLNKSPLRYLHNLDTKKKKKFIYYQLDYKLIIIKKIELLLCTKAIATQQIFVY